MAQPSPYTPGRSRAAFLAAGTSSPSSRSAVASRGPATTRWTDPCGAWRAGDREDVALARLPADRGRRDVLCIWVTAGEDRSDRSAPSGGPPGDDDMAALRGSISRQAARLPLVTVGVPGVASVTKSGGAAEERADLEARELEEVLRAVLKNRDRVPALILFVDEISRRMRRDSHARVRLAASSGRGPGSRRRRSSQRGCRMLRSTSLGR
jgi:hypothetical protein